MAGSRERVRATVGPQPEAGSATQAPTVWESRSLPWSPSTRTVPLPLRGSGRRHGCCHEGRNGTVHSMVCVRTAAWRGWYGAVRGKDQVDGRLYKPGRAGGQRLPSRPPEGVTQARRCPSAKRGCSKPAAVLRRGQEELRGSRAGSPGHEDCARETDTGQRRPMLRVRPEFLALQGERGSEVEAHRPHLPPGR